MPIKKKKKKKKGTYEENHIGIEHSLVDLLKIKPSKHRVELLEVDSHMPTECNSFYRTRQVLCFEC